MDQSIGQFAAFLLLFICFWLAMLGWTVDIRRLRRAEAERDNLADHNQRLANGLDVMKAAVKNLEAERDAAKEDLDMAKATVKSHEAELEDNLEVISGQSQALVELNAALKRFEAMPRTSGKKLLENIEQAGLACATVYAQIIEAQEAANSKKS